MKSLEKIGKLYCHFPQLVTVAGIRAGGRDNLIPLAWFSPVSFNPPLVAIMVAPKRFSHNMIIEAGSFTLNFLSYENAELIKHLGSTSGRDVDKFQRFNVPMANAMSIDAPLIATAYSALECKLVDHKLYGDHTLFVGEIVRVHYLEEAFDEKHVLVTSSFKPILYLGSDHYITVDHSTRKVIPR